MQPDRRGAARRYRRDHAGTADRDRQVAEHRRPRGGALRARSGQAYRWLDGLRRRRRDPRRDPATRPDQWDFRGDGGWGDRRGTSQTGRIRPARSGRRDGRFQYRGRPQDPRCGGRPGGSHISDPALAEGGEGGRHYPITTLLEYVKLLAFKAVTR